MRLTRRASLLGAALILASCAQSKFRRYDGPEVTRVVVDKGARKMRLYHHGDVLRSFDVALGWAPQGHKAFEGDGRTPEGLYYIDRQNPNSRFHLSLGISYPNEADRAFAAAVGQPPGGDIFIHGRAKRPISRRDWTDGCVAVNDREMEDIYAMVRVGTPIQINA